MADSHCQEQVPGKAYGSRLVIRLLAYLRPYKWRVVASLALTTLSAPLLLAGPPLIKEAADLFLAPDPLRAPSGFGLLLKRCAELIGFGDSQSRELLFIALVLLSANIAAFAVQYMQYMFLEGLGQHVMYDLRADIFAHLQQLSIPFYDRNPVGSLMTRLTTDVDAINEIFTSGVLVLLGNTALAFYTFIWMFQINWRLALISSIAIPLMAIISTWVRIRARAAFRETRVRMASINTFLQERITGMHIAQLFNREAKEAVAFDSINKDYWKASINAVFCNAFFYPAVNIIATTSIALIIWYGGGQVMIGMASVGTLIAFIQLARSFYDWALELSEKYNTLQDAMASCERIFTLLDEPVTIKSPDNPVLNGKARGRIEFRNVWFAYKGDNWVLRDVSFIAEPGEKVAFVGHTGAGKTTITNLLLRFYDIQRGQILFDDLDIREMDLQELRSNFSIVLQDVFLFSVDLASNIRLGNKAITDDMVKKAAGEVYADAFIAKLQDSYNFELMEQGAGLSVGQKQLIGFARAVAFDRCVFILDEATSSIDTETEMLIRDAVERLMASRTSLIIAHRLSTIQSVNKIIVMHKGEVKEVGCHQSLLAKRGLYWRLYQLQFYKNLRRIVFETSADD